ncbi:hypothetical protein O181_130176 [Austropuccinia psidii MF-1]|uniref:Uncharacterized protein n=1 Tax=Austropuccinia psidii MF-1 TaxID=1389203 RepID=A0A9Q3L1J9_9BASI|nr:hypothetical protein [Austropuccinia psidii MF-1]
MSSFSLSVYLDENGREIIAILYNGFGHTIHFIQSTNNHHNPAHTTPPTSIIPFYGSTLAWPQSKNPLPTTNGHHSPPSLVEDIGSQPVSASADNPALHSISISATTDSNTSSKLCQPFDVFDPLFCQYCHYFYDYFQHHPDNASDYSSL